MPARLKQWITRMSTNPSHEKPLKDVAYEALENMIIRGRIRGGSLFSEAELAQQINIGRTPVREALQQLAQVGLVTVLPRRGIMVVDVTIAMQLQVLEIRRPLERLLASCAALRANASQRAAMLELASATEKSAEAGDGDEFLQATRRNHAALEEASGNELIQSVMSLVHARSRRFWYIHYERWGDLGAAGAAHANLMRSISLGNEAAAIENADRLVDYLEQFCRATIEPYGKK